MKTVLLTGATSGIGLATGLCLANEGYEVYGIGRTIKQDMEYPENFRLFSCDITNTEALNETLQAIRTQMKEPAPDILIHSISYATSLDPAMRPRLFVKR